MQLDWHASLLHTTNWSRPLQRIIHPNRVPPGNHAEAVKKLGQAPHNDHEFLVTTSGCWEPFPFFHKLVLRLKRFPKTSTHEKTAKASRPSRSTILTLHTSNVNEGNRSQAGVW